MVIRFRNITKKGLILILYAIIPFIVHAQDPLLHKDFEDAFLKGIKKPSFIDENYDVFIYKNIDNKQALNDLYDGKYNVDMSIERIVDFLKKSSSISCHKVNYAFDVAPINGTIQCKITFKDGKILHFEYAYTGYGFLYDEKNKIIWGLGNPKMLAHMEYSDSKCDSLIIKNDDDYKKFQYPNDISPANPRVKLE